METSKQRTERLMAMPHAQLLMHCQDLTTERDKLKKAAQAVVDRWDSPNWKDQPHTGNYISDLREALKESA